MNLPIQPPFQPMEMTQVERIPDGPQWEYEPKWDGFRALIFRDGDQIEIQSKSRQPLARYFPEVVERLHSLAPDKFVLDGELMVQIGDELSFDALLQRIHPAQSRVDRLAAETPARLVVFDLLANERGEDLTGKTLDERRAELESFAGRYFEGADPALSPATLERAVVDEWFKHIGNALDGVVAKRRD